jgi:hypothetical protein
MKPIRALLAAVGLASPGKTAEIAHPPEVKPDVAKVYPYVIPADYLEGATRARTLSWPLGHGLHVALVHDLDGLVRNVTPEELSGLGLNLDAAKKQAVDNLSLLFKSGEIKASRFNGPVGKPFILVGDTGPPPPALLFPTCTNSPHPISAPRSSA